MVGRVYGVGCAAAGAMERVEQLMADPLMLLVDIRLVSRSRWYPQWNKRALKARWGTRYTHEHCLGNVNYRDPDLPVQLRAPRGSIQGTVRLLQQGYSLLLLCVCAKEETCHRKVVAEMIQQMWEAGEGDESDRAKGGEG